MSSKAWVLIAENYVREHPKEELSAQEIAKKCPPPADVASLIYERSFGEYLANKLREHKNDAGQRLNGCYKSGDKFVWKPLDIMTAAQLRESWSLRLKHAVGDLKQMVIDQELYDQMLVKRQAAPLGEHWKDIILANLEMALV